MRTLLACSAVALALAAPAAAGRVVRVGAAADGATVRVRVGDALVLSLASNPSTGCSWSVRSGTGGPLALRSTAYVQPSGPPLPGKPGTFVARLTARRPGSATLRLVYGRPWSSSPPVRRFAVTVVVRR